VDNEYCMQACYQFFLSLDCTSDHNRDIVHEDGDEDKILAVIDEDKMRCHFICCIAALQLVDVRRDKLEGVADNENYESVKRKYLMQLFQ
jgi:hypothetical protein